MPHRRGFADISHFNRSFRHAFGDTPSACVCARNAAHGSALGRAAGLPLDSIPANWHEPPTFTPACGPMKIKTFFLRLFTWWNGQTFGTQVWTALYGEFVGEDEFGNRYYRTKGGKIDPALGFERRWVIYSGYAEASTDPAVLARLDAPHGGYAADRREVQPVRLGEAASPEHDRHARGAASDRVDAGARPPPEGDRRLQGVGPGERGITNLPAVFRPLPAVFPVLTSRSLGRA